MRSEFRVLPWDFFALPDAPPPHVEAIQISGAPRRFELLPRGGRVYFRLEDASDARVWATLDDGDTTNFVRTFRRAIGSGRIGGIFQTWRLFGYSKTLIYVLMSAHGEVQGREWCATRWFDLKPNSPRLAVYLETNRGIFHPKWAPPFREVLKDGFGDFFSQPLTEENRALTQERCVKGDEATLCRLVSPFVWRFREQFPGLSNDLWRIQTLTEEVWGENQLVFPASTFPPNVSALLEWHFKTRGVDWGTHHERPIRSAWEFYSTKTIRISAEPSAHERLEALLFLREWLEGKLPSQEISALLA